MKCVTLDKNLAVLILIYDKLNLLIHDQATYILK